MRNITTVPVRYFHLLVGKYQYPDENTPVADLVPVRCVCLFFACPGSVPIPVTKEIVHRHYRFGEGRPLLFSFHPVLDREYRQSFVAGRSLPAGGEAGWL